MKRPKGKIVDKPIPKKARRPQHTPGPWRAGRPDMATYISGYQGKYIYAGDQEDPEKSRYVAAAVGHDVENWAEVMANAYLIAAAPELLGVCRSLLKVFQGRHAVAYSDLEGIAGQLSDAIARAEGKV